MAFRGQAAMGLWGENPYGTKGGDSFFGQGKKPKPLSPLDQSRVNVDDAIKAAMEKVFGLEGVENQRGQAAEDYLRGAVEEANQPSFTSSMAAIGQTRGGDAAARRFLGGMGGLRDYLGGAGITGGGYVAGLASNLELQRQAQVLDTRSSLAIQKASSDAMDRVRRFQSQVSLAGQIGRAPSTVGADFMKELVGVRLGQQGIETDMEAARQQAKAAKKAGSQNMFGQIIGGLFGLL